MPFISKSTACPGERISLSLGRCHDLGNTDLWDKIHLLFKAAIDNEDMSPEVRIDQINCELERIVRLLFFSF